MMLKSLIYILLQFEQNMFRKRFVSYNIKELLVTTKVRYYQHCYLWITYAIRNLVLYNLFQRNRLQPRHV